VILIATGVALSAELIGLRRRLVFPMNPSLRVVRPHLRSVALGVVAVAQVLLLPTWNLLGVLPVGAIIGAGMAARDSQPTTGSVAKKLPMNPLRRSAVILVVLTGVGSVRSGGNWMDPGALSDSAIEFLAIAVVGSLAAWVVHLGLTDLGKRMSQEVSGYVRRLHQHDRRNRAQWVHDHLLSELSFVILRLQALPDTNQEAIRILRDVDHRLRIAQLDDLIESGPTRIASLVQPHVRRSLDLGVVVNPLPGYEQVDVAVDSDTGRLISRVLAVLFSNAMNAGAHTIGLDVIVGPLEVEIRVTDDAGGFDLGDLQPGRGLEELMTDLGRDGVARETVLGGSVMRVTVPRPMLTWVQKSQTESVPQASTRQRLMTNMRGRCR
jgi:signal transduction histidine kinase